ncbi:MAG TPA: hypothetical protein VF049_00105 [Nocardioidaceae bacterium]
MRLPDRYEQAYLRKGAATREEVDRLALSPTELLARLIEVEKLDQKMWQPGMPAELVRGYAERGSAILKAMPRDELDRELTRLEHTAMNANDPTLRAGAWQRHTALKSANPQPSIESVAEARRQMAAQRPARPAVQPKAAPARRSAPAAPAGDRMLYKDAAAIIRREVGEAVRRQEAAADRLARQVREVQGRIEADNRAQGWPPPVVKAAGGKPRSRGSAQAAEYRRKAAATTDPVLRQGYEQLAREAEG